MGPALHCGYSFCSSSSYSPWLIIYWPTRDVFNSLHMPNLSLPQGVSLCCAFPEPFPVIRSSLAFAPRLLASMLEGCIISADRLLGREDSLLLLFKESLVKSSANPRLVCFCSRAPPLPWDFPLLTLRGSMGNRKWLCSQHAHHRLSCFSSAGVVSLCPQPPFRNRNDYHQFYKEKTAQVCTRSNL